MIQQTEDRHVAGEVGTPGEGSMATPLAECPNGRLTNAHRTYLWPALGWAVVSAMSLHLAYSSPRLVLLTMLYPFGLVQLARTQTWRAAFYCGLFAGMVIASVDLAFFWRIFSGGAIALWLVYSFWTGLFVALARLCVIRLKARWRWALIPILWCGLEYFRSELYYLRFSWLSPAFAFGTLPSMIPTHYLGGYGIGFMLMAIACGASFLWTRSKLGGSAVLLAGSASLLVVGHLTSRGSPTLPASSFHVAAVQMEFPTEGEVLGRLNELIRACPEAQLLVLSEYTFLEPVPEKVMNWCREHHRYLLVGGKEAIGNNDFYDTGYVVSPEGKIVFQQAKSVPIQFFKDGRPAQEQKLWDSPWGKIGICICYDLSYSRVTDRLVREGAQALIVPTMDVVDWGSKQHALHARVAPLRASEYGIPIFRVASSGISQLVDAKGQVTASAPYPGDGAKISGIMELRSRGRLPLDRWLAPTSTVLTAAFILFVIVEASLPGHGFRKSSGSVS